MFWWIVWFGKFVSFVVFVWFFWNRLYFGVLGIDSEVIGVMRIVVFVNFVGKFLEDFGFSVEILGWVKYDLVCNVFGDFDVFFEDIRVLENFFEGGNGYILRNSNEVEVVLVVYIGYVKKIFFGMFESI